MNKLQHKVESEEERWQVQLTQKEHEISNLKSKLGQQNVIANEPVS